MIYLDTHVVVWFHANDRQRFPQSIQALMNQHEWTISPMVRLELQYLHDIGRINPTVNVIMTDLVQRTGLTICAKPFNDVIEQAMKISWTRDPFDRIIVAQATISNDILVTADQTIHTYYPQAKW